MPAASLGSKQGSNRPPSVEPEGEVHAGSGQLLSFIKQLLLPSWLWICRVQHRGGSKPQMRVRSGWVTFDPDPQTEAAVGELNASAPGSLLANRNVQEHQPPDGDELKEEKG